MENQHGTWIKEPGDVYNALEEFIDAATEPDLARYILVEAVAAVHHLADRCQIDMKVIYAEAEGLYKAQVNRELEAIGVQEGSD